MESISLLPLCRSDSPYDTTPSFRRRAVRKCTMGHSLQLQIGRYYRGTETAIEVNDARRPHTLSCSISTIPVFHIIDFMSGEKKQKPEDLLNKLRKLEENKHCVNCGEYAKLGHSNVCGRKWGGCNSWNSSLLLVCVPQLQVGSPILLASCEGNWRWGGVTNRASQCPLGR